MPDRLVFLDFDGVLCDSLPECLVSSWHAYYGLLKGGLPDRVPLALHAAFHEIRPYIRSGEDYVLLQELIDTGARVCCQEDFDAHLQLKGEQTMRHYKELFYQARAELLRTDKPYWIGLNRIYPFLLPHLRSWAASPCLRILSTKKASFILEILAANGVLIDAERVLHCDAQGKSDAIAEALRERPDRRVLWIDDQVDHLRAHHEQLRDAAVSRCLAAWGFVKREWLEQDLGLEVLRPPQVAGKLASWLCPPGE